MMFLDKFNKGNGLRKEEARRCPIAKLAGKKNCWGPACGWHTPGTKTGCLILETGQLTVNTTKVLVEIKTNLDALRADIHEQLNVLAEASRQRNLQVEEASKEGENGSIP
jgi:hypothetical protein